MDRSGDGQSPGAVGKVFYRWSVCGWSSGTQYLQRCS